MYHKYHLNCDAVFQVLNKRREIESAFWMWAWPAGEMNAAGGFGWGPQFWKKEKDPERDLAPGPCLVVRITGLEPARGAH